MPDLTEENGFTRGRAQDMEGKSGDKDEKRDEAPHALIQPPAREIGADP